ncbi:MAG: acetylglutamate kinase [Lachnospiraceae bacterium]|nr:acetylglutamate kinase [Lachnospiraceae bacterium]
MDKHEHLEEVQKKAEVLIEALPYIRKFNRKVIVVKYGGSAMENDELKKNVIKDVTLLKLVGFKPIIVHGGGKEINRWVSRVNRESNFINGLRETDEDMMEIVEMVLSKVNKSLVNMIQELGVKAIGISGKDGGMLKAEKMLSEGKDIGFVGEIKDVDPKILFNLLDNDFLPVVAPTGFDENFNTFNINADDAACAIAKAVNADKLVFLTDVEGLYRNYPDENSFVSRICVSEADELLRSGNINGGMLPKLRNCIDAIQGGDNLENHTNGDRKQGVGRVHILDGRIPHCLLLEIFTNEGIGTAIIRDEEVGTKL